MITLEQMKSLPKNNFPEFIVVHHSAASADQTFKSIQDYHISLGWDNIGYHYIIGKNGTTTPGRPEHRNGAHVKEQGINTKSIGICLVGDFNKTKPTVEQIKTLTSLLKSLQATYKIPTEKIVPHRYFLGKPPYKNCFGSLPDDWAQKLVDCPVTPKDIILKRLQELTKLVEEL